MKLNELFYTVQGEGRNAGRAALFIRMPFCNLSCPWCDTEFDSFTEFSEQAIAESIDHCPSRFAVVTGGEPSMNKEVPQLICLLKAKGFEVAMESNGQFLAPEGVDHLTVSPKRWTTKTGKPGTHPPYWFHPDNRPSELKLVVDDETPDTVVDDIYRRWVKGEFRFKNESDPAFYLSPEWGAKERVLPRIVKYVQENPQWRISIQSHKVMSVK